ncbi:bile acid:sodium symporter family protein [Aurantiacibacter gangjinensis]|uniref:Uncharacterized protein n=1 Tax=Aurantiacibacter gangjinensis TaxID=502682 RepID=A0A0G9MTZ1_9SPHN|nr:bile acid:sodium symporter family protein [Aurantiacibacter gangjinensis]APE28601.1 Sodium/bile acid symporter family [Aurantiacibacter gangjinensis]KLE32788.1 hypothetical protein AAW01_01755 [Aurantiacibacter gangjinensis]
MLARLAILFDPLVRLLLLAILLATIVPVTGEGRAVARTASDAAIFVLFLLNGLRLPRSAVVGALRNLRFLLPLVLFVFGWMGLVGFSAAELAKVELPASIVLGFMFLGVLPSTVQSATAYTSIAGGNVANSVIAAAALNLLGVFLTAPLLAVMSGSVMADLDIDTLQRIGLILLLPFAIGQMLQGRFGKAVSDNRHLISWADRIAIALAVYVSFSGAVEQDVWRLLSPPLWGLLLTLIGLMMAQAFFGAWWLSALLRLPDHDRIAFLFGGAQKSIAMGAPLAAILFPPETAGLVLLPVLIYHLLQMIVSAPLAARFSRSG